MNSDHDDILIREALLGEEIEVAGLIMLAWPVEDFLAADTSRTYEDLRDMIAGMVSRDNTIYSYANTFVAVIEGKIAGAMCGYDGADYQRLKQPITKVLGEGSEFARLVETEAGEYYLDSVGVMQEHRGRGIATRLFEAHFTRARSLGHTCVGLIVDVDKPEAEALYRSLGFKHIGYRDFFGHQMKHMVKALQ